MHTLKIKTDNDYLINYYKNLSQPYERDCGVDLITPETINIPNGCVTKIKLGIQCEFIPFNDIISGPFDLVPRSSIVNTPLQLANSIGIIDPEYRGELMACVRSFDDYFLEKGTRLFQIVAPDRKPIKVVLVDELTPTKRGQNGFGSTGK